MKIVSHIKVARNLFLIIAVYLYMISPDYLFAGTPEKIFIPWENGQLNVSDNGHFLQHSNGTPFFWLGETAWLLPQRLNRDEVEFYLDRCQLNSYNVIQIQVLNDVPSINIYGQYSMKKVYNFQNIDEEGEYGYWDHLDFIIKEAGKRGIYVGMVCIWGGLVKSGKMNSEEAQSYGTFLATRYLNEPNIIWIIGGDVTGDTHSAEWESLAKSIRDKDKKHLMTFHPRGRTSSATWFHNKEWLDFNMFQSGHRRYGQRMGDENYPIEENTEEDNWRYAELAYKKVPHKPVLDGEPSYEDIPQGLHDVAEPRWRACDVRRYAYWSVFAGSFGHTYGHNSIMQMLKPGVKAAYGATRYWYDAINDQGFAQMQYLKKLILTFPYFERIPDQQVIAGKNGEKYDRVIATRGNDYLLVYNYIGRKMEIDLNRISGDKKMVWWYNPRDGNLEYIGEFDSGIVSFQHGSNGTSDNDYVLIAVDSKKEYIGKDWSTIQSYPSLNEK